MWKMLKGSKSFTTIKSMLRETYLLVLKKDFRRKRRRGGKMDYRWQGTFAITAVLGKGLYYLKERDRDQVLNKCMFLYLNLVGESFYA